jgi:benzoyl-CoA reductase/2-hydroxyglutaryl-CoA dehydratase subunit BcrC/BadD/HgdB
MDVFYSSPWVPAEWIQAHGLTPRGVWPVEPARSVPVPAGVCALAQSFLHLARLHPEAGVIFASTCDQMRRACDELAERHSRLFLFNIPATWQSATAREMYRAELVRLGQFLQGLGGIAPGPAELAAIMREHEELRARLRARVERAPARAGAEAIAHYHATHQVGPEPAAPPAQATHRVAIALVGSPLCPAHWDLLDAIEAAGARVALNATETGERSLTPRLPSADGSADPLSALADGYFDHITDVFQRPNTRLYEWLGRLLDERAVRGLVVWSWAGCDLWRAEAASLREAFGRPVLLLEAGETASDSPRALGRLQAFVEMLE